jgi:molybdopterin/thiamine biosynthesis adenylyltransferase
MTTLVLAEREATLIEEAARGTLETAGVLLATLVEAADGDLRLFGRQLFLVDDVFYRRRSHDGLSIASEGYVGALGTADRLHAIPIWFHTHPGLDGQPLPSTHDRIVDEKIGDLFRFRANAPFYGTLIVSPRSDGVAFSGALHAEGGAVQPLTYLWRVGDDWRLTRAFDVPGIALSAAYDRNIRAFGTGIQTALAELRVAVVGCGGTGSAVAEQLVRLGVRDLILIDGDSLSASNLTRVYGSTAHDVGRPKAVVLREHLLEIAPDLKCQALVSMVTQEATARGLIGRDVVFGCTDDNAGRLVLSRVASFLLTPVIDVGVLLTSDRAGILTGIDGRVTILTPGAACLVCRDRIDLARAAAEQMAPSERSRLQDEGYAPALAGVEPAVVTFTTAVAAAAVSELLERMTGYGPRPRPNEILLRLHEREISTNIAVPRLHHYCDVRTGKLGAATLKPFLEQTWIVQ